MNVRGDGVVPLQAREILSKLQFQDEGDIERGVPKEERARCISPAMGRLLHALVLVHRPHRIIEIGTSAGYSTIWLACAARAVGARVDTVEQDARKCAWAANNFSRAGVSDSIDIHEQAAADFIRNSQVVWDFAFLDHGSSQYIESFDCVRQRLSTTGVVVADGWRSFELWETDPNQRSFLEHLLRAVGFTTVLLPIDKGPLLAIRCSSSRLEPLEGGPHSAFS